MTLVLGLFLLVSTVLAGLVTIGHHGAWAVVGAVVVSLVVNIGLFVVAFRLLTPKQIPWGDMLPGAVAGAADGPFCSRRRRPGRALAAEHQQGVRHVRARVGPHQLSLPGRPGDPLRIRAQCGPVRRLWPRGMVQPPLTAADKEVLSSIALEGKRRPEQYVSTGFRAEPRATESEPDRRRAVNGEHRFLLSSMGIPLTKN